MATKFVIPGDKIVPENAVSAGKKRKLCGRGIVVHEGDAFASVSGFVHESDDKLWVNSFYRRYFPQSADKVIGIVTLKIGDFWRVDIGGIEKAEIEFTQFENATKKNRPDVRIGDMLYGNVTVINKHLEPVMSCVDAAGNARGMGLLPRDGIIFAVSCSYSRRLLTDNCKLLSLLGKSFVFEVTVGVNGRIWIRATPDDTRFLRDLIKHCEKVNDEDLEATVANAIAAARGEAAPHVPGGRNVKQEVKEEIDDDPMEQL
uniref:Ribosomal RNA-processing protein 40 n=1 Tax=Panagrellus redivivus TaxID=6233 RepID=A0A7E4UMF7_PANRE